MTTMLERLVTAFRTLSLRSPAMWAEAVLKRLQSVPLQRRNFDVEWYLHTSSDIEGYKGSLFDHWRIYGAYEGRPARFFDANSYRRLYSDIRLYPAGAYTHYRRIGKGEGRHARYFYVNSGHRKQEARPYDEWINLYDQRSGKSARTIKAVQNLLDLNRRIDIVFIAPNTILDRNMLRRTLLAVRNQSYHPFRCLIGVPADVSETVVKVINDIAKSDSRFEIFPIAANLNEAAAFTALAALATADYFCMLSVHDILDRDALFWIAVALSQNGDAALIYADEDKLNGKARRSAPLFRPQFNYELFLTHNMLGSFVVYRRETFDQVGGIDLATRDFRHDLGLRVFEAAGESGILHTPRVLNHRFEAPSPERDIGSVENHLRRTNRKGHVKPHPKLAGYARVRFTLPNPKPMVSIIIPTRDRLELVRLAVESVLTKTTYTPFELIIIDNGSKAPSTLNYFKSLTDRRVRVVRDDRPFNFSALNNAAVAVAKGDYVCLMNNDIEILTPDWLEEMMSFAVQPDIGCVGAQLWYPDGTLQHGGVLVGFHGIAGHMHKHLSREETGYADRALLHQSLSAVTAAVLLVRKAIYQQVGGFDEALAVSFNDVDFCLKVRNAGFRNVYTPFAEMNHYESASRGSEDSPAKKAREAAEIQILKDRYGESLLHDPAYNPNLTLLREDFTLAFPPRVKSAKNLLAEAQAKPSALHKGSKP